MVILLGESFTQNDRGQPSGQPSGDHEEKVNGSPKSKKKKKKEKIPLNKDLEPYNLSVVGKKGGPMSIFQNMKEQHIWHFKDKNALQKARCQNTLALHGYFVLLEFQIWEFLRSCIFFIFFIIINYYKYFLFCVLRLHFIRNVCSVLLCSTLPLLITLNISGMNKWESVHSWFQAVFVVYFSKTYSLRLRLLLPSICKEFMDVFVPPDDCLLYYHKHTWFLRDGIAINMLYTLKFKTRQHLSWNGMIIQ